MTNEELLKMREVVRQELGKGEISVEFADLVKVETGDSGEPQEYDSMHPMAMFNESTDDIVKFFQAGRDERELQKLNRSRVEPNRNPAPATKPEDISCEECFGASEKRASSPHKIKLTKRLVDGDLLIEGFDHDGSCVYTRVVEVGEDISAGEPLAKASITSSMLKTLAQIRAALLPEEFEAAQKAVKALDVDAFLQICRRAQITA